MKIEVTEPTKQSEFAAKLIEIAKHEAAETNDIKPMLFFEYDDGKIEACSLSMFGDWNNNPRLRDHITMHVKNYAKAAPVQSLTFLSDVWRTLIKDMAGAKAAGMDLENTSRWTPEQVAKWAERREAIMVSIETRNAPHRMFCQYYRRRPGGIEWQELEALPALPEHDSSGRLMNLLPGGE